MNSNIISQFNDLLKQIEAEYLSAQMDNDVKLQTTDKFRIKHVKQVINIIKKLDFEITDVNQVKGIPGIGAGTLKRISEILETNHLSEIHNKYNKTQQKKINGIQELENVIGIGPKTAKKLVVDHKITSVEQLKMAIKKHKIKVNEKILLGLKYYNVVKLNIPRDEITDTEKYLKIEASAIDPELHIVICGSYRRGKATSNDIDLLMYHPKIQYTYDIRNYKMNKERPYLELYVDKLEKDRFLLDHLTDTHSNMKYMGFEQYKKYPVRRIDIKFIPYNSLYPALLHFTGPFSLNEQMRHRAKKRHMMLNEYGLYRVNEDGSKTLIPVNSEKEIFEKLGMEYLTPEQRETYNTK